MKEFNFSSQQERASQQMPQFLLLLNQQGVKSQEVPKSALPRVNTRFHQENIQNINNFNSQFGKQEKSIPYIFKIQNSYPQYYEEKQLSLEMKYSFGSDLKNSEMKNSENKVFKMNRQSSNQSIETSNTLMKNSYEKNKDRISSLDLNSLPNILMQNQIFQEQKEQQNFSNKIIFKKLNQDQKFKSDKNVSKENIFFKQKQYLFKKEQSYQSNHNQFELQENQHSINKQKDPIIIQQILNENMEIKKKLQRNDEILSLMMRKMQEINLSQSQENQITTEDENSQYLNDKIRSIASPTIIKYKTHNKDHLNNLQYLSKKINFGNKNSTKNEYNIDIMNTENSQNLQNNEKNLNVTFQPFQFAQYNKNQQQNDIKTPQNITQQKEIKLKENQIQINSQKTNEQQQNSKINEFFSQEQDDLRSEIMSPNHVRQRFPRDVFSLKKKNTLKQ